MPHHPKSRDHTVHLGRGDRSGRAPPAAGARALRTPIARSIMSTTFWGMKHDREGIEVFHQETAKAGGGPTVTVW
jgi:hypothetical protein